MSYYSDADRATDFGPVGGDSGDGASAGSDDGGGDGGDSGGSNGGTSSGSGGGGSGASAGSTGGSTSGGGSGGGSSSSSYTDEDRATDFGPVPSDDEPAPEPEPEPSQPSDGDGGSEPDYSDFQPAPGQVDESEDPPSPEPDPSPPADSSDEFQPAPGQIDESEDPSPGETVDSDPTPPDPSDVQPAPGQVDESEGPPPEMADPANRPGGATPAGEQTPGNTGVGDAPGDQGVEAMTATTGAIVMGPEGLTTERELARQIEQGILERNPALQEEDIAIGEDFQPRYTQSYRRRRARQTQRAETTRREEFGGVGPAPGSETQQAETTRSEEFGDVGPAPDPAIERAEEFGVSEADARIERELEETVAARRDVPTEEVNLRRGQDFVIDETDDGRRVARFTESYEQELATAEIEQSLEQRYGVDIVPGRDFEVRQEGERYEGELTDQGQITIASRVETGETWLDENVINPALEAVGVDYPAGEGDLVQQTEAALRREAAYHRTGQGWLPSAEEAEAAVEDYERPPGFSLAPSEESLEGFAERFGETVNPAGLAYMAGEATEEVGEYGYNRAVATLVEPDEKRPVDRVQVGEQNIGEAGRVAGERARAQEAAAAAAAGGLVAASAKAIREQPARTSGAAVFEIGTLAAGEALSPIRLGSARFATVSDDAARATTTYRGVTLQTPRVVRGVADIVPRPIVGAVDRRPTLGTPDVGDLATGQVPRTPLETRIFRRTVSGDIEGAGELIDAERSLAQLGVMAGGRRQTVRTAEEAVGEAKRIPPGAEAEIVDYLRTQGDELKGSAGQATAVGRTRTPADVDVLTDDPARAAEDLAEITRQYTDSPIRVTGGQNVEIFGDTQFVHLFDVKNVATESPGQYFRYGRQVQRPVTTAEGVPVQQISEQFQRKATASLMTRGEGIRATRLGPEPHRAKDVLDTVTIGRDLIEQEQRRLRTRFNPLRRRRVRRAEAAVETFEEYLGSDLAAARRELGDEIMDAPPRPGPTRFDFPDIRRQLDREMLGPAERGQLDLAFGRRGRQALDEFDDIRRAVDTDVTDARRVDTDYYDDAARRYSAPVGAGGVASGLAGMAARSGGRAVSGPSGGVTARSGGAAAAPGYSPTTGGFTEYAAPTTGGFDYRVPTDAYSPPVPEPSGGMGGPSGGPGGGGGSPGVPSDGPAYGGPYPGVTGGGGPPYTPTPDIPEYPVSGSGRYRGTDDFDELLRGTGDFVEADEVTGTGILAIEEVAERAGRDLDAQMAAVDRQYAEGS